MVMGRTKQEREGQAAASSVHSICPTARVETCCSAGAPAASESPSLNARDSLHTSRNGPGLY